MRAPIAIFLATLGQIAWAGHTCNPCNSFPLPSPPPPPPCGFKPQNHPDATWSEAGGPSSSPLSLQLPSQSITSDLSGIPSSFLLPPQQTKPLPPSQCPDSYPVWAQPEEKCFRHIPVIQKYRNSLIETRTRHVPIIKKRFRTVVEPYTTHVPILEKYCHPVEETIVRSVPVFDRNVRNFYPSPSPVSIKFPSPSAPQNQAYALTSSSCLLPHPNQPLHEQGPRPLPVPSPIPSQCGSSSYPSPPPCVYSY